MRLLFTNQSFQLLVYCMDDQESVTSLNYVPVSFSSDIIKINHYIQLFISTYSINSALHTNLAPVSYGNNIPPIILK